MGGAGGGVGGRAGGCTSLAVIYIYRRGEGVGRGGCVSGDHIIPVGMLSGSDKEGEVEVWLRWLGGWGIT